MTPTHWYLLSEALFLISLIGSSFWVGRGIPWVSCLWCFLAGLLAFLQGTYAS